MQRSSHERHEHDMHVDKSITSPPSHVSPEHLGEDEDWLRNVASEMEIEDGVIWVYGAGDDGVQAFTDFGIENLIELVLPPLETLPS